MKTQKRGEHVRRRIVLLLQKRESANQVPPPTVRELARVIGRSPSSILRHVEVLEQLGVLERRQPGLARTIRLRTEDPS